MHRLDVATIVARKDGFIEAEIDREVVVLSVESGTCYGLNRTGSRVWNLLAKPGRVRDLCATLIVEYNVDPEVCEADVLDLLEELRAEGLIAAIEQA
jgi:Coenzyme PQQ synthesis protein D (PqqD)